MIYSLLRAIAGIALRWYYADVTIGRDPMAPGDPPSVAAGPLLVVVNHPNALVDVLVAGRAVPRRLVLTAKSTLFSNPVSSALLSWLGVVPLRRASDEPGARPDPARNAPVFDAITRVLGKGGAVLIFPEGKTHDEPAIAPLRTGVARIALNARDDKSIRGIRVLPIGLVFQRKEVPRSRVLAIVGDPIDIDAWKPRAKETAVADLTTEIDTRLRAITLNYENADQAESDARLAMQIAGLIRFDAPSVGSAGSLRAEANIARLLPAIRKALRSEEPDRGTRAVVFETALISFQRSLDDHHISLNDLAISRGVKEGAVFVAREALLVLVAGPVAAWGWINHLIPFSAALAVGKRSRESNADPAMRTIIAGTAFVLMVYMLQGAAVALFLGPLWALFYVLSLPIAADVNLRFGERLDRAVRRARTYLLFRARPELQRQLTERALGLRAEALELARIAGVTAR